MYAHGLVGWRSLAALNVRDVIAAARAAAQACGACYTLTIAKIFTFRAGKTYCSSLDQLPYQSPRLMAITLSDVRFRGNSGHCSTPRYPMALSHQNRLERGKAYSGDSDTLLALALIESFPCPPNSGALPAAEFAARSSQRGAVAPPDAEEIELRRSHWLDMPRPRPQRYHPSVLTLRTPIGSYAVIGRMGLNVPVGNEETPGDAHTRELLFWG